MLVNLGMAPKGEGELVDLMLECHERIRRFTALAQTLGRRADISASEVTEACLRCERYFEVALPLHVRDEEESLLPRLRGLDAELDAALATMAKQHQGHEPLLKELLQASAGLRAAPLDAAARQRLLRAADALAMDFEEHLKQEETIIFPGVRRLLSASAQADVRSELRARRGARP